MRWREQDYDTSGRREEGGVLLPIRGTASLVLGITELTMFIKTVSDNRIVTPRQNISYKYRSNLVSV